MQRDQGFARGLELGAQALEVQRGLDAPAVALQGEIDGPGFQAHRLLGDGAALLLAAQVDVDPRHLGGEGDADVVEIGGDGVGLVGRGLGRALLAAEKVHLPGGVEARVVELQLSPR